jgi:hypothetical protein
LAGAGAAAPGQAQPSGEWAPPADQGQAPDQGQWAPPPGQGQPSGEWAPPPGPAQPSGEWAPAAGQAPDQGQWAQPGQPAAAAGQPSGQWGAQGGYAQPSGEWGASQGGYGQPGQPQAGYGQPSGQWGAAPPGAYGQAPGTGGYAPPPGKSRKGLFVLLGALVVVALAAGAFVLTSGGDDEEASDEVVLEPIGSVQEDDFAGNLDIEDVAAGISQALTAEPAFEQTPAATLAARTATGTEPGLYGGSQDAGVCNVDQLTAFLTDPANEAKAEAWAGVLGVPVSDISSYVSGLTAVRLRFDTRVTNHGFRDGEANAFQSLLQAGTAVLVDAEGVPRVKCNCGNPLAPPTDLAGESVSSIDSVAQNPDAAWDGLDPANVVTVTPGQTASDFTLVSNESGALFTRPVGSNGTEDTSLTEFGDLCDTFADSPTCGGNITLGTGNVQITLQWASSADLDLHVTEPDGNEIYFSNKGPSASQGILDVDSNVGCSADGSVENVYWPEASPAPAGEYSIEVVGYDVGEAGGPECGAGDYILTIKVEGRDDEIHQETVADQETDTYPLTIG